MTLENGYTWISDTIDDGHIRVKLTAGQIEGHNVCELQIERLDGIPCAMVATLTQREMDWLGIHPKEIPIG